MDLETFLTTVYVTVDDLVKSRMPKERDHPGPDASLSRSEVITLGMLSQWHRFASQRGFYRYAVRELHSAFPRLPDRSQFNRLLRQHWQAVVAFALELSELLGSLATAYQVGDGMGMRVRNSKRRGNGWLDGKANIGWSNRLGWYEGFNVLLANTAGGAITGFGIGAASTNDRVMAETFFAARHYLEPRLPSVGKPADCPYLLDKGFAGQLWQRRWQERYGAQTICVPQRNSSKPWPKALRRWHAGLRQIAETVHEKLVDAFRWDQERPHEIDGLLSRLASMVALHNFCLWLNQQLGRKPLAFADILDW
jgi:hypothetical protein